MHILATSTAFPEHYFSQREVIDAFLAYWGGDAKFRAILERLHLHTGVDGRYFARPLDDYIALDTWGKTNNVWIEVAQELGERAIDCAPGTPMTRCTRSPTWSWPVSHAKSFGWRKTTISPLWIGPARPLDFTTRIRSPICRVGTIAAEGTEKG